MPYLGRFTPSGHDFYILSAQSAANVLIIGLASEDCYVALRTPHNDKEYIMQRSLEKGDEGIPAQSAET